MILLRKDGTPCVFYADYYGNPAYDRPMVPNLGKMIRLRHSYAYGEQADYFDNEHVIGWVRRGDEEHPNSGIAVVLSNAEGGSVKMEMGRQFAGTRFYDAFGSTEKPVIIGEDGTGEFSVGEQSVSVWVRKGAREDLTINE